MVRAFNRVSRRNLMVSQGSYCYCWTVYSHTCLSSSCTGLSSCSSTFISEPVIIVLLMASILRGWCLRNGAAGCHKEAKDHVSLMCSKQPVNVGLVRKIRKNSRDCNLMSTSSHKSITGSQKNISLLGKTKE